MHEKTYSLIWAGSFFMHFFQISLSLSYRKLF
nr:MAG TPA: hypothetical protein [Caudoviricetes sp.]